VEVVVFSLEKLGGILIQAVPAKFVCRMNGLEVRASGGCIIPHKISFPLPFCALVY
jgi:hypothetical protein